MQHLPPLDALPPLIAASFADFFARSSAAHEARMLGIYIVLYRVRLAVVVMATITFPETVQRDVACLVDYCRQRVGPIRRGFDFRAFYRELREHAGVSATTGPTVADIAFVQFLREKINEIKLKKAHSFSIMESPLILVGA
jgi:hypothetical protein